jgi:hypothetical protein
MKNRWLVAPVVCVAAGIAVVMTFSALNRKAIRAERENLIAASQRYPQFTVAQRRAVLRESLSERHPRWRDLSLAELAHRLMLIASSTTGTGVQPLANFTGNLTGITVPGGDLMGMFRQSNCSLTLNWASYILSMPSANLHSGRNDAQLRSDPAQRRGTDDQRRQLASRLRRPAGGNYGA